MGCKKIAMEFVENIMQGMSHFLRERMVFLRNQTSCQFFVMLELV